MGLRGAFSNMRGLNHFQPVMVFSLKRHILLFLFNTFTYSEYISFTILHIWSNVNQLFFEFYLELLLFLKVQSPEVNLDHAFDPKQLHESA